MLRSILTVILALFLTYGLAYGQLGSKDAVNVAPTDLDRIKVGQPAPDFTLENLDGKNISLSDYRGKKSVVLVFYRGHW